MRYVCDLVTMLILAVSWLAGIAIAKGIWEVGFAICVPPYSWYLVVQRITGF